MIQPKDIDEFLPPLPVGRIPGVGKVTEAHLKQMGIQTVGDLRGVGSHHARSALGRYGLRLYELAQGIDDNPVTPDRPTKSISAEDTLNRTFPCPKPKI